MNNILDKMSHKEFHQCKYSRSEPGLQQKNCILGKILHPNMKLYLVQIDHFGSLGQNIICSQKRCLLWINKGDG